MTGVSIHAFLAFLSIWWVVGLYLDGRGHLAGGHRAFFTAEHAVLYATFPVFAVVFYRLLAQNGVTLREVTRHLAGTHLFWIAGTILFGLGGVVDYYWHDASFAHPDAWIMFSPPHLLVIASGVLIVSGLLRARWRDPSAIRNRWRTHLPELMSASALLSIASFLTILANPFVDPLAVASDSSHLGISVPSIQSSFHLTRELGVLSILFQTVVLMAVVLILVWKFSPRIGSFTLLFGIYAILLSLLTNQSQFIPIIISAGVTADGLYHWSRNRVDSTNVARLLAFSVPIVLFSLYFIKLSFVDTIAWGTTTSLATIALAGVIGLSVNYAVRSLTGALILDEPSIDSDRPVISSESMSNIQTFSSSDAIDHYTNRARDGLFPQERKVIERYFRQPDARVLDLGCGTGRATQPLLDRGFDVVGVDPSPAMIAEATSIYPSIEFITGDGTGLPFKDNSFDYLLFTYYGLDYIHPEENRVRALNEIYRVLKPGGLFVFSSHNWWSVPPSVLYEGTDALRPLFEGRRTLDPRDRYTSVEVHVGETLVYLSSPLKQRSQLEKIGFELVSVVGKRDTMLRYFEVAPHYVARVPNDDR